jgi:hypothetical protein
MRQDDTVVKHQRLFETPGVMQRQSGAHGVVLLAVQLPAQFPQLKEKRFHIIETPSHVVETSGRPQ